MSTAIQEAPAKAGASPVEKALRRTIRAFRKVGSFAFVRMENVDEGDVIVTENAAYCIVRKEAHCRGSVMSVRNVVTNAVKTVKFLPRARTSLLRLPSIFSLDGRSWIVRTGDVVIFPKEKTALIRHSKLWYRTQAPWTAVSDGEVLLALTQGKAKVLRNSIRPGFKGVPEHLGVHAVVATADPRDREPSVWVRVAQDHWVGSTRGLTMSTAMIQYELGRGTYEVLQPPEK